MSDPASSRRQFLSGQAALQQVQHAGAILADAVAEVAVPAAGDTIRLETRAMACPWCVVLNPAPPGQQAAAVSGAVSTPRAGTVSTPRHVMAASDALDRLHEIEAWLTIFRDSSEVATINRLSAGETVTLSASLLELLLTARQIEDETAGAFTVAAGAAIELWKAERLAGRIPAADAVARAQSCCGLQRGFSINPQHGTLTKLIGEARLDFGAIGKGYAIDQLAAALDAELVPDYLVHGGHSSLYVRGGHNDRAGWPVGVKNPLFPDRRYATVLLRDCGWSTSGSNIQFFRHEGQRYGHILDPRTGWPAAGLLSVSVAAPTALQADALSTAFYAMGLSATLAYAESHPDIAVLAFTATGGPTVELIVRNFPATDLFPE